MSLFRKHLIPALILVMMGWGGQFCAADVNGIYRELYTGINGSLLSDLTNSPAFLANTSSSNLVTGFFEAPVNVLDNYGQRMRALIVAPQTGSYVFWICSDDQSALYLSTDETAARKILICVEPQWNNSRDWDTAVRRSGGTNFFPAMVQPSLPANVSSNTVGPINLVAGQRYYLEALMKEGVGGDNLAVGWQYIGAGGFVERPIPASRLIAVGISPPIPPVMQSQPASISVAERASATFSVQVTSFAPPSYQWQRESNNISGATNTSYQISSAAMTDSNAHFRCVIASALGTNVSAEAILTVLPDIIPPTIVSAGNDTATNVLIRFSESVDSATGTNIASYNLGSVTIFSASFFSADHTTVALVTAPLTSGSNYTVTVNTVRDTAATPNTIGTNATKSFIVLDYAMWDIGAPAMPGSAVTAGNGFDLTSVGNTPGATDQMLFGYQRRTGDFDLKVRVQTLGLADVWSSAGLLARATLDTNSVFAAALATPSISGSYFQSRAATGGASANTGTFPVNYPNTWLRLGRVGNLFTGYASADGQNWTVLGSATLSMGSTVYLGMELNSRNPLLSSTAQFRDLGDNTGGTIATLPSAIEPPGPSSRRTGVIISEIMYHPADRLDGRNGEFIELMNTQPYPEDLSGFQLAGAIDYSFPTNTIIVAGGLLVVAKAPADLQSIYGISNALGGYSGVLPNSSGTILLRDRIGAILLEANYSGDPPWPAAADGAGHSLVLTRPSYGEGNAAAWAISDQVGGSPGTLDGLRFDPLRSVMINEFLAHTDLPDLDFIELYNHSNQAVDLSGCILSDDPVSNKFVIPNGTTIPARGFISYNENQLGFRLSASGETIFFKKADISRVLDAVRFEAQANGISMGRFPDGASEFYALTNKTPGSANGGLLVRNVVINEIMYHPISGLDDDRYVELYNRGTTNINVGGWSFVSGIKYTFPPGQVIPAGGYLVVAANAARLMTNYPNLTAANTLGNFNGHLSHHGERVALAMPDTQISTNVLGQAVTNQVFIVVDEVTYGVGGRWGQWANGGGSSLELIDARGDHRRASNWGDSDETRKSSWSNVEFTGILDNGNTNYLADSLQVFLLGEGESLLDNIEVVGPAGTNLIVNPTFETGLTNWFLQGDHDQSTLEAAEGYGGSAQSLHLRAGQRGDPGANRIRVPLTVPLTNGQTATLRAKARWLRGSPEILLKLHGNYLEAAGELSLPANLGTPGAPNSRAVVNVGPAIFNVSHFPILPTAGQPVVVTAGVHDPDGLQSVILNYRVDPASSYASVLMRDDGAGGDAIAGDGIYSATIPGQINGAMIAFYVQATDNFSVPAITRFPSDAPVRECLVHFGEAPPASNFGSYRVWLTANTINRWTTRDKLNNSPLDATFVYGNQRVVYNAGALYSGSPWHMNNWNGPTNSLSDYVVNYPEDDQVLGVTDCVLATLGNLNNDDTAQREQFAFWICRQLGTPNDYRRYVQMYVNGVRRAQVYEDAQQPNGEMINEFFPDDPNGDLYKIEDWFEFDNPATSFKNVNATMQNFTTTGGVKKTARYRWNWRKRAVNGSSSDYSRFFPLIDAVNVSDTNIFTARVQAIMDVDEWMRVLAVEHLVGNWDSFGYRRGKNMYAYKPLNGKWRLMPWDIDFVLGSGSDGATSDLFQSTTQPLINRMFNHPPFRRIYLQALQTALNGPLQDANNSWLLDAKYAAFLGNGIPVNNPGAVKSFLGGRRAYIQSQLDLAAAAFAITSNGGNNFSTNNNFLDLSGTAPLLVKTISINGASFPATWTSVNAWHVLLPLKAGSNQLNVVGLDSNGSPVAGATAGIAVTYTGPSSSPIGNVVINEIMYNPAIPRASYLEIFNNSTNITFDLSSNRVDGIGYTFPNGSLIQPGGFLLLVKDRTVFASTFGGGIPVFDEFAGRLGNDSQLLQLIQPGATAAQDVIVSEVRYEGASPWPASADGTGASLQLLDPRQGSGRVANWSAATGWKFVSVTGPATSSLIYVYLDSPGDVFIDDLALVAGTIPAVGTNYLRNGDWESPLTNLWTVSTNLTSSLVTNISRHNGSNSLHLISSSAGSTKTSAIWQNTLPLVTNGTYTLSFWFLPGTNGSNLIVRLSGSGIAASTNIQPDAVVMAAATPGVTNSIQTILPSIPPLWLNEVQPNNVNGIADQLGQHDPWVELFNSGSNILTLDGYYLTDDYNYPGKWAFPSNLVINPGQFLIVWCDAEPTQTTLTEWHANFRLDPANGSIALSRLQNNQLQVLDYLTYRQMTAGRSYGAFPDGQPAHRQVFQYVTPAGTNNSASIPVTVFINEWMADNVRTLPNPVGGAYDDWFELYNPGAVSVDLSGYSLTDTLTNKTASVIPAGYSVPAHGYLVVWADGRPSRNSATNADLHANFQLSKTGEAIGLFAPDGTQIDAITFGLQTTDVAQGRYPDGGPNIYFLPANTPRGPNAQPNFAPLLGFISDKVVNANQLLSFTATASDSNTPPQTLSFSLDAGAPTNAIINPGSGLFNWMPSTAQSPGTNVITIRVADNGTPVLSDARSFTVIVVSAPHITGISRPAPDSMAITWESYPGKTYRVQYTDSLTNPQWTNIVPDITAINPTLSITTRVDASSQRFFRVIQVN